MVLTVPDRIHIAPVGYEETRVYEAAEQLKANKVILIGHEGDFGNAEEYPRGREHLDEVREHLDDAGIANNLIRCDFFDLYDSLGTIAETILEFEDEEVYVNIATGSKITAVAGTIASMVTEATAYYVKAEVYDDIPIGVDQIIDLPRYPIQEPDPEQINVLNFIKHFQDQGKEVTKGHVINFSENQRLPYISRDVGGKAKYRLLDTHIVDPLQKNDYISVHPEGRNKVLEVTEKGENLLRAFRYMIDTEPETSEQNH